MYSWSHFKSEVTDWSQQCCVFHCQCALYMATPLENVGSGWLNFTSWILPAWKMKDDVRQSFTFILNLTVKVFLMIMTVAWIKEMTGYHRFNERWKYYLTPLPLERCRKSDFIFNFRKSCSFKQTPSLNNLALLPSVIKPDYKWYIARMHSWLDIFCLKTF